MSSAPVRSRTLFARSISSEVSQWTESKMPPSVRRPSYLFASYSGIPIPTSAPARPPTAPPTPAPARAATIGPAAMKGPTPGIASEPIPTSQPRIPPSTAPDPAPAVAPSGAFDALWVPSSRLLTDSGSSTATSELANLSSLVVCKRFPDFSREITVSLVFGLLLGGSGTFIAVLLVGLAIVGSLSKRRGARDHHAESRQDYGGLAFLQNCSIS